jgi:DNA-binding transcriptional LysR family regulator
MLMPSLLAEIAKRAADCAVQVLTVNVPQIDAQLTDGEADLAVGLVPEPSPHLRRRVLYSERSVCVARRGHPGLAGPLAAEQFASLPHIQVAPSGVRYFSHALDEALAKQGLVRRVVFTSPHFLLAAHVVTTTDAVVFLPQRIAERLATTLPLMVFEPPLAVPNYEIAMLWHERVHASPPHNWLRELIAEILPGR